MKYHITMTENDNIGNTRTWSSAHTSGSPEERPYYQLDMYVSSEDQELKNRYREAISVHNSAVQSCLLHDGHCDAGFDLFNPTKHEICGGCTAKLDHKVKCSMKRFTPGASGFSVGYHLYPRSSTGTKTPLRLANSVGIIDSGYRGNIIAVFDNWKTRTDRENSSHVVEEYDRVVQICPPDLTYPMRVLMVENDALLGTTERGEGGFGSTGR
jgi:dUTP pyrophosphatase